MRLADYARAVRAPRYSVLFAAPLFLLYESFAWTAGTGEVTVRNGAEMVIKWPFLLLGGRTGLLLFYVILLGLAGFLLLNDWRKSGAPASPVLGGMALEAVVYAPVFWVVVARLTAAVLG